MHTRKPVILWFLPALMVVLMLALSACGSAKTTTSDAAPAAPTTSSSTLSTAVTTNPATTKPVTTTASTASQPAVTSSAPSKTASAPTTQPATSAPVSGAGLSSILSKSANITMKYDMTTAATISGTPMSITAKVWFKGGKMKMDTTAAGIHAIMYINTTDQSVVMYMPDQKMAIKSSLAQANVTPEQTNMSSIMQYQPVQVGTDTVDGKLCTIVTYTSPSGSTKAWIWQDKGLPVRTETTSDKGNSVTTFTNYDFSDFADSELTLPAGVTVTDMGSLIPSGLPTGIPTGLPIPTGVKIPGN